MAFRKTAFVRPEIKVQDGRSAFVFYNGHKHHLGYWNGQGTPPPAVLEKYLALVSHLEQAFIARMAGIEEPVEDMRFVTTRRVILEYLMHLENDPDGYRREGGTLSYEFQEAKYALHVLDCRCGERSVRSLTAQDLDELRASILPNKADPRWHRWWTREQHPGEKAKRPGPWSIDLINKRIKHIQRMFAWAEKRGYVDKGTAESMRTVRALPKENFQPTKRQRIRAQRKWVDNRSVKLVLPYLSPTLRTMVLVQRRTGMRPSEVMKMKPKMIQHDGWEGYWVYRLGPRQHKTGKKTGAKYVLLDRRCRKLLEPFMDRDPSDYLFKPRESDAWHRENRKAKTGKPPRKTPIYPSEVRRRERIKKERAARRKRNPNGRYMGERYHRHSYCEAIGRAIKKARADGHTLRDWTPYSLRHARITELAGTVGVVNAQRQVGHKKVNQTIAYNHKQITECIRISQMEEKVRRRRKRRAKVLKMPEQQQVG